MIPIIKPQELAQLKQNRKIVLIDARTGSDAKLMYAAEHLQGALHVDLEQGLAGKKTNAADGGRHPLPDVSIFSQLLGQLGIQPDSHVVVYDDKQGANAAARFWWMLKAAGHNQVQVLDGGYQAALTAGLPTGSEAELPTAALPYHFDKWQLPTADIDEVAGAATSPAALIVDVRDPERFRGEKEPIDLVAGHIPGAINVPFASNLDQSGFFLSPSELFAKYKKLLGEAHPEDVIIHCGSGVTACHTLLAMNYAGFKIPRLYVGSWSEWSRNDHPVATGA